MTTKERLSRQALVMDTVAELQKRNPNVGEWLRKAILDKELKDLEIATVIQDVDERLDDIGRSEQDPA